MTNLFSQRYRYTSDDIFIREEMPISIQNAICNWYDMLPDTYVYNNEDCSSLKIELNEHLWSKFLNQRTQVYYDYCRLGNAPEVFIDFIYDTEQPWYRKLDILEVSLSFIEGLYKSNFSCFEHSPSEYTKSLNEEFSRLNYAYRIIDLKIVEITSKIEIECIEQAIDDSDNRIKMHLSSAVSLLSKRPEGDYRNSIKESISAVEVWCRARTKENDLRTALNKLESKGIISVPLKLGRLNISQIAPVLGGQVVL